MIMIKVILQNPPYLHLADGYRAAAAAAEDRGD